MKAECWLFTCYMRLGAKPEILLVILSTTLIIFQPVRSRATLTVCNGFGSSSPNKIHGAAFPISGLKQTLVHIWLI